MKKTKYLLALALLLAAMLLVTGCAQESTPYQINNKDNYKVSVRFDANGGNFTTNTAVIVDSYNLSDLPVGANGKAQLALITPDNPARGKENTFNPTKAGHFLYGWYTQRTQVGTDEGGNPIYTYSGKWDFEKTLELDPQGEYSAQEPVLTLYAAWVPQFQVEFCEVGSDTVMATYSFSPSEQNSLELPQWDMETGSIEMYKFPAKNNYTFKAAYLDKEAKQAIDAASLTHPGTVDDATATAQNGTMRVYVEYMEGNWFHIYNVDQFVKHANVRNSLEIHADLDFTDKIWPSNLMTGTFTGTIHGNGHTLRNITFTHKSTKDTYAGLFGRLDSNAAIEGVTFENVSFTISGGAMNFGTSYGLLAGSVADDARLTDVAIPSGTIYIDSRCYFGTDDYSIGLVCGMGDPGDIDYSAIACLPCGENPEKVIITVDGNTVIAKINME